MRNVVKISNHIIPRFRVMGVQKRRFQRPKNKFSSKVAKFAGTIRIDLVMISYINRSFCATLSFQDIVNLVNIVFKFYKCFCYMCSYYKYLMMMVLLQIRFNIILNFPSSPFWFFFIIWNISSTKLLRNMRSKQSLQNHIVLVFILFISLFFS